MTNQEKIKAICDQMDNWDLETLLDWAKGARGALLMQLSDGMLEQVYQEDVVGPPERYIHTRGNDEPK